MLSCCQIERSRELNPNDPKYEMYRQVANVVFTSFDIDTEAPAAKVNLELFRACAAN